MTNYKVILQYKGTKYSGFCKQVDRPSVEEELEKSLAILLREKPSIRVAGRTDAGVHALGQVISFKGASVNYELDEMRYRLNSILPDDISISEISIADDSFHARYGASARQYVYYLLNRRYPSIFNMDQCHYYSKKMDVAAMQEAANILIGQHDFKAFSAQDTKDSYVRDLSIFKVENKSDFFDVADSDMIRFTVKANSFLYRMVRNMVGTLIEVGLGNIQISTVKSILESKDRITAGPTAAAKGLFLQKVFY